jgi:hypothetical protein
MNSKNAGESFRVSNHAFNHAGLLIGQAAPPPASGPQVQALLLIVPVAGDAASLRRRCLWPEGRMGRSKTTEAKMRKYSLAELFNFTRAELFALHATILTELAALTDTADRDIALGNLRLIRRALAQHGPVPVL